MQELTSTEVLAVSGGNRLWSGRELAAAGRFAGAVGLVYSSFNAGYTVGSGIYTFYTHLKYH